MRNAEGATSLVSTAYTLQYGPDVVGIHRFCGVNTTAGAVCPNCKRPLLRFILLNLSDPLLVDLRRVLQCSELPVLWCWTCTLSQGWFSYELADDGRSVILRSVQIGDPSPGFPYEDYPVAFPGGGAKLLPVAPEIQAKIRELNAGSTAFHEVNLEPWARPSHTVGGEAFLNQRNLREKTCGDCATPLRFMATVADDCLDARGFAGNPFVQVVYWWCEKCRRIGAEQDSD